MYMPLAANVLVRSTGPEYSRAVEVLPKGTIEVQGTVLFLDTATLQIHLEESNNGQDWIEREPLSYVSLAAVSYGAARFSEIEARLVRLKYVVQVTGNSPSGSCIFAAGLRTEDLEPTTVSTPPQSALARRRHGTAEAITVELFERLSVAAREPVPPVYPRLFTSPTRNALNPKLFAGTISQDTTTPIRHPSSHGPPYSRPSAPTSARARSLAIREAHTHPFRRSRTRGLSFVPSKIRFSPPSTRPAANSPSRLYESPTTKWRLDTAGVRVPESLRISSPPRMRQAAER